MNNNNFLVSLIWEGVKKGVWSAIKEIGLDIKYLSEKAAEEDEEDDSEPQK